MINFDLSFDYESSRAVELILIILNVEDDDLSTTSNVETIFKVHGYTAYMHVNINVNKPFKLR